MFLGFLLLIVIVISIFLLCRAWNSTASEAVAAQAPPTEPTSKVDSLLTTAERYIRQYGRISRKQLDPIVSTLDKEGTINVRSSQALLRLYGSYLFDEPPSARLKLAEELWEKYKELGIPLDVTHYNTLLGVYIQNGQKFSPSEFLANMEANGVKPNRVTYQRLIAQFCEDGDIPGATQVLEHMKANSLPISDQVFNAFITGHMRAKDPESARNILEAMRQAGLDPTSETYLALAVGFAEMGEIEEVKKYVNEAEIENVPLRSGQMMEIYSALAKAGHTHLLKDVIQFLRNGMLFNQDAIRTCSHLIMAGNDDAAYQLFLEMPKPANTDSEQATYGRFLLRALARHERSVEKVVEIVQDMQNRQLNKDDLSGVVQLAYLENKPAYAISLLEKMKSQNLPIRAHYFWPAFCQFRDAKNAEAVYETAEKMSALADNRDDFVHTLHSFVIPALLAAGEKPEDIISKLQTCGFQEKEVNFAHFIHLLEEGNVQAAADFLEAHDVLIIMGSLRATLLPLVTGAKEYQPLLRILSLLRAQANSWQGMALDVTAAVLKLALDKQSKSNWTDTQQIFDFMVEKGLQISKRNAKELSEAMAGAPPEVLERLNELVSSDSTAVPGRETPETLSPDLTIQELRKLAEKDPSNKAVQKRLLIKACAIGDVEEAESVRSRLEAEGFVFPPIVLSQLAYLYSMFVKDLSKAQRYLEQLETKFPEHTSYMTALVKTAALQASENKVDDAVSALERYANKHKEIVSRQDFRREDYLADIVRAAPDVDSAKRLRDTLASCGYVPPENLALLEAYMDKVLASGDSDKILQETEDIIKTYRKSPNIDSVLKFFIDKEDPERLQKVVDLLAELHGLMNVYHHLIADFIECGHVKKARKVMDTPGLRANMQRLNYYCQNFIERKKIKELEALVDVTKTLFGVDRDNMLFHLMRGYVSQNNMQLAQDVLLRYEEEMLQPSPRTLRFLARSLQRAGMPVPFDIPEFEALSPPPTQKAQQKPATESKEVPKAAEVPAASAQSLKLKTSIENGDIEQAIATLQGGNKKLLAQAISQMKRPWPIAGLRSVFESLAKAGDVETLKSIAERRLPAPLKNSLKSNIFSAAVESGRPTEAIDAMETSPANAAKYLSIPGLVALREKAPELVDRVESWSKKMLTEKKYLEPIGIMWSYHMYNNNPQAKKLVEEIPDLPKFALVTELCSMAINENK
ncbi:hypothetical protein BaRGS_00025226, partial [Batillaria attramentaria]